MYALTLSVSFTFIAHSITLLYLLLTMRVRSFLGLLLVRWVSVVLRRILLMLLRWLLRIVQRSLLILVFVRLRLMLRVQVMVVSLLSVLFTVQVSRLLKSLT